jgi:hypothetical protein
VISEAMQRLTAYRTFSTEYLHGLRNGLSSEDSERKAMDAVKAKFIADPANRGISEIDLLDRWRVVLDSVIENRILWFSISPMIDRAAIPPRDQIEEAFSCGKPLGATDSGGHNLGDAVGDAGPQSPLVGA